MSSFLFQKDEVDCACFQSNSNSIRKIFRSDPLQPPSTSTKDIKEFSFTNQGQKIKNKKKSLKKEKPSSLAGSDKGEKRQDQACQDLNMPQVNVKSQINTTNKLQANYFHHVETGRYQALISERNRPIYSIRPSQQAVVTFSQNFIPLNRNAAQQIHRSEHRIKSDQKEQYDQLVQQEFKKDFYQFKLNMEIKENEEKLKTQRQRQATERQQKQKQEKQKLYKQRASIEQLEKKVQQELQNQRKQQITYQNKQKINKEKYLKEKQLRERETKIKQLREKELFSNKKERAQKRKESFSANKIHLEKMQSLPAIPHMKLIQKPFLDDHRENPLKSIRNSAISHRERETLTKRTKGMCPKQIESEKDGSSESDSDRMSEVVGRGWDGLTQQKIQMEQLDQMVKDEQNKSETLVTRESHIKNSQIKTFTDYTSSFISPKSQQANPTAFGGGQKYGLAGMSYQLIDDLGKGKTNSNSKIFF